MIIMCLFAQESTQQAREGPLRRARRLGALEGALALRPHCPSALMELRSGQRLGDNSH